MNLANKLTLMRIFLVPVFLIFIVVRQIPYGRSIATAIFIIAAITDKLDGYIARSRNQVTKFGKIMDPLADKLLVSSALIALVEFHVIPAWIAIVIIAREFAVTGLRSVAAGEGIVIAASWWGKIKTFIQIVTIIFALLFINLRKNYDFRKFVDQFALLSNHSAQVEKFLRYGTDITLAIAFIVTLISGIDYFYKNRHVFINDK
ncbi:CDP-diacylglycerol--glycerol-3-phosphate 3-phosphatidyltransferase [Clostridium acetobutylicum]|uniref:CDP-diacylglycerol--glycerol-3-phosphate 3-phosphatidyltransferase n=1 Tax=Clostridium acetobutylicum (strain ATCC 824 / DSM 792 / JCM 1419 / IAM 19013 / LMG 5710 / NBRC 13948 / NRRL B-527 / VKM B-1787 / 2291 / W) TaxID=272562 RepID=Q97I39_CLOAB|nr:MULTISPECIES: CDP-diacylglycerol--glycerol-3-phosphate 3-phosphatidyltransferase [Clostridium]AAK79779.1 Phosphatidylglycerophosphate synthase [Clostridium acetobutylicum ATCC 824]ADZ20864.1 Phosphatidylglycerophosphate synthase [Clostridium acetobutylicum EA 2018]AEI34444.1 phosphatidylglycerophosphate synthase [Clostridium acetobutylicum DSM 1731]AWV79786.1 CDP-diacylglycerol--glycerol-3-phosphate 3-phosphatidyltransferase [Clostridium acetobutylicum]KHD38104.1 CDP-diacylglycerol--glycero